MKENQILEQMTPAGFLPCSTLEDLRPGPVGAYVSLPFWDLDK